MSEIQRGVIPIAVAARVLKMDCQTLRLLLQNKVVDFGVCYKRPGSRRYSYVIFAEPFCELTGYKMPEKVEV
nr:MAG TPA: hypothetical protein [Caudoviricetes sp.]